MKRLQRLDLLWTWLPAFRAVAETQHLPTAGRALNVSASALSRSIRLLEDAVGIELFDRRGRELLLNDAGLRFLDAVRNAMRGVDEGLEEIAGRHLSGPVVLSASGPLVPIFVLPALASVRSAHPNLVPVLCAHPAAEVVDRLRRGAIDLALLDEPVAAPSLAAQHLATLRHGVYCGDDHALRSARLLTLEQVADHPFVAPRADASGRSADAWPAPARRHVALQVADMQMGIDACRGGLLAVLPDRVAQRHGLHRLDVDLSATSELFLLRRPPLPIEGRIDVLAAALVERVPRD